MPGGISYPWAAEGLRASASGGFLMGRPLDKILCEGKFYRYVVACMHNCPNPHFCREFWHFFDAVGKTPAEYYNEDGIGERAMRRVVFDCDRCGKRDIEEMFGLYNTGGEAEEFRISPEERVRNAEKLGYSTPDVPAVSYAILAELEKVRGWQHFCGKCFQAVVDSAGRILNLAPKVEGGTPRKKPATKKGASADGASGDELAPGATASEPTVVDIPAPVEPQPVHAIPADIPVPRSKGRGLQTRPVEPPAPPAPAAPGRKAAAPEPERTARPADAGKPLEAGKSRGHGKESSATPPALTQEPAARGEEPPPVPERRRPGRPRKVPPTPTILPLKS